MGSVSSNRVFVVDDDEDIREIISEILINHGYEVETAQNGAEALAQLRSGMRPCVILLDLMMPGMNGFEFRAEQLLDPELADIPVVVLTGAGQATRTAALGTEVLRKPMELAPLLSVVGRFCPI